MNGLKTLVVAAAGCFTALSSTAVVAPPKEDRVTLIVHRVKQLNNLDADLPLEHDDADFFAYVWIDGQQFKTKNFSSDDGRPYWTITAFTKKDLVKVRIRLLDDDGGLENEDDHVDINKWSGEKDISFVFNTRTGRITGDVTGRARQMISAQGYGKNQKGRLWFTIE